MALTIKISDKNATFLNTFREHPREFWNDLFDKMRKKLEGAKTK